MVYYRAHKTLNFFLRYLGFEFEVEQSLELILFGILLHIIVLHMTQFLYHIM